MNMPITKTARNEIRTQYQAKDKLVIGNVGRFSQQKNQMYLVDIFSEIRKIHKDSVLWLVGDGELRPQIVEKNKTTWVDKFSKKYLEWWITQESYIRQWMSWSCHLYSKGRQ